MQNVKDFVARRLWASNAHPKRISPALDCIALAMVRNEQDIIEPFLRHNARCVDLLFLVDNNSTDQTRRIAHEVARDLGNIIISDRSENAYQQSRVMSQMLLHTQFAAFSDFILFLDADEFLAVDGKPELIAKLDKISKGEAGQVCWKTFVPDPTASPDEMPDPMQRLRLRRKSEMPPIFKSVLRAGGKIVSNATVRQGNHKIAVKGASLPAIFLPDLPLIHMPLRSAEQLLAKGLVSYQANAARSDGRRPGDAYQWQRLNDIATQDITPDPQRLAEEALNYAQKPREGVFRDHVMPDEHGIHAERKYSDGRFASLETIMAGLKTPPKPFEITMPQRSRETADKNAADTAFDHDWHLQNLFLDVAPFRFLVEHLEARSILDLGCGSGLYPRLYLQLGVADVVGVDGLATQATFLTAENYIEADLQKPLALRRKFDLVVCLEVVEHLAPDTTSIAFDTITDHASDTILFSMAEPGQPGNGHINCMKISSSLQLFAERGWHPDLALTLGMRGIASLQWFKRNMMVLKKSSAPAPRATEILSRIGDLPFKWYTQETGIVAEAYQAKLRTRRRGYDVR